MKMPKLKDLVTGTVVEESVAQDLRNQMEQDAEKKREIVRLINTIDEPVQITVFQKTGNWEIRNIKFWKLLQEKDEDVIEYLSEVLAHGR